MRGNGRIKFHDNFQVKDIFKIQCLVTVKSNSMYLNSYTKHTKLTLSLIIINSASLTRTSSILSPSLGTPSAAKKIIFNQNSMANGRQKGKIKDRQNKGEAQDPMRINNHPKRLVSQ